MKDIEKLIPHRAPFLFLDEITSVDAENINGNRTFAKSESFVTESFPGTRFVPGMILIESMVQCGGAGVQMLGLTKGLFGLANIENANFIRRVKFGEKVCYEVKNIRIGKKIIKQSGIAKVDGDIVADASWMCVRID
ncbi:MAG TPA: 3-hydroxyacyl-ACP dehydratase FabZ family protein [Cyclobacteriaceae bacterium]|nr:3-hydroxyacyl-ACP dehydratase FabZ family protein [Cyclobacteriaceae bacterium]